jgi:signal transduction histidine kinase
VRTLPVSQRWMMRPFVPGVAATLLLLLGVGIALYEDRIAGARHLVEVTEQANVFAASVTAAVEFGDRRAAATYLEALKINPEIMAAAVYDGRGRMLSQFMRGGARKPPPTPDAFRDFKPVSDRIRLLVPVVEKSVQIGTVYWSASGESFEIRTARFVGIALLGAMAALVLAVLATAQLNLARANAALNRKAADLASANERLNLEMTERRQAEEALMQSQKLEAIGQLSGGIAHDLNNFFSIIKGNLQLLRRRLAQGRVGVESYVDSAEEGLEKAMALTQRILAFARRQPLLTERVNLGTLIEGMLDLIRQSVGKDVVVETRLESHWQTRCDPGQMETILLNLAINARDAMPRGGRLKIHTCDRVISAGAEELLPHGNYVELSVSDTGSGMTDEVRRKALEPFFTTKPPGQGTGLGLSTAFSYIRQAGGGFTIASEVGRGTVIAILLPQDLARADNLEVTGA